jgi:hypothetical protein
VFSTAEALAAWCVDGATVFGSHTVTYETWLGIITNERIAAVEIAPGIIAI